MTRVLRVLVHNWPLKLAAIGLATLLYGGLVLSSSQRSFTTVIPIVVEGQPDGSFLLTQPEPVTEIRYFSASGVQPIASDFRAHIDISNIEPGSGPHSVPIQVDAIDTRITRARRPAPERDRRARPADQQVGERRSCRHRRHRPVSRIGEVQVQPAAVQVSGPASVLTRVVEVRADVSIQSAGLDFDQDVSLVPVDELGNAVAQVKVEPQTARITIPVFSDLETRQLPISPLITGDPAAGFEFVAATVDPKVVTVQGDADQLAQLLSIDTEAVSINGLSADRSFEAALALPTGVIALDIETVAVAIDVRPMTGTRSFDVGLRLLGTQGDLTYDPAVDRVLITVGGSVADLDRLNGAALVADLDVADLGPGERTATVTVDLPAGVTLVAASPAEVAITVTAPPSPSPAAIASPSQPSSPDPSPSPGP